MPNKYYYTYADLVDMTGLQEKKLRNLEINHEIKTRNPKDGAKQAYLPDIIHALTAKVTDTKDLKNEQMRVDIALKKQKLNEERDSIRAEERADYRYVTARRLEALKECLKEWSTDKHIADKIIKAIDDSKAKLDDTIDVRG